jgi:hypothetical protein
MAIKVGESLCTVNLYKVNMFENMFNKDTNSFLY